MEFVDTHCHLNFQSYSDDLVEVIARASQNGVNHIVVPGVDLESSRLAVDLADKFPTVFAAVGVHPGDVDGFQLHEVKAFEDFLSSNKVVAIGEIGLDYYHRQDQKELQQEILKIFLHLAKDSNKPVILHSRESLNDLFDILLKHYPTPCQFSAHGVFHAFEGNYEDATKASALGFYLGAGGPITYKNAHIKQEVFSKINPEKVVLETDGPFLPPQSHRGKRNEPSLIPVIAESIAELQHCDIKEIACITTENARKLFNWN